MSNDSTQSLDDNGMLSQLLALVQSMRTDLSSLQATVASMDTRLSSLETRVDERLRETRPIWERALAEIAELRVGQEELRVGQEAMRVELEQMRKDIRLGLHKVERQIMYISKDYVEMRADQGMLEDRIEKLEGERQ